MTLMSRENEKTVTTPSTLSLCSLSTFGTTVNPHPCSVHGVKLPLCLSEPNQSRRPFYLARVLTTPETHKPFLRCMRAPPLSKGKTSQRPRQSGRRREREKTKQRGSLALIYCTVCPEHASQSITPPGHITPHHTTVVPLLYYTLPLPLVHQCK